MSKSNQQQLRALQDRFGRRVAVRLDAGVAELPYDISERLRAARVQALARRKAMPVWLQGAASASGGTLTLGSEPDNLGFWGRLASAVPLVVLAAGLIMINVIQNDRRAQEVAEVDAALLTDDLPPAAYADPGFVQFLKNSAERGE